MKDAAAQPSVDEHPVDDETIQNWSICVRVPQRDTVSVRGNNRRSGFLPERWKRLYDDRRQRRENVSGYARRCIDMRADEIIISGSVHSSGSGRRTGPGLVPSAEGNDIASAALEGYQKLSSSSFRGSPSNC